MSGIGGIFRFAGEPVEPERVGSLGSALSLRGPDGGGQFVDGSLGFVSRAFYVTPESQFEQFPSVFEGGYVVCWDGRLDNRSELADELSMECGGRDQSDPAFVMAAYRRWGEGFAARLLGDFAVTVWDPIEQKLLLARDHLGARTLYYNFGERGILWASDLTALVSQLSHPMELDLDYVAGFLGFYPGPHLTPFRDVCAVRPGHVLRVAGDGVAREWRYWGPDPRAEIRYGSDAEYEEHFLHLFRLAVGARLRSRGPVFAELSGGLDSSSVVCMGDRLIGEGVAACPRLETVSLVMRESISSDEKRFINVVEAQRGVISNYVWEEEFRSFGAYKDSDRISLINGILMSSGYQDRLAELMGSAGSRVLLSGLGGDELLQSVSDPSCELADLLMQGRMGRLHSRLYMWSYLLKEPYVQLLLKKAVVPTLPNVIQARLPREKLRSVPPWYLPEFVRRFRLRERSMPPADVFGHRLPGARMTVAGYLATVMSVGGGVRQEIGGCEVAFPYLDRRLVEFLLAVPFEQKLRPNETRSLMRRALSGILPAEILGRKGKGDPIEVSCRSFGEARDFLSELFADARVSAWGLVNREKLSAALERACYRSDEPTGALFSTITLELWLRSMERRGVLISGSGVSERVALTRSRSRERLIARGPSGVTFGQSKTLVRDTSE